MSFLHTPVAIIGIGTMGLAMALRLLLAGQAVRVHDIDARRHALAAAAGAELADSPAAAAQACALLIVAVMDAAQTEQVLFGAQGAVTALPAGAAVMLCPTIAPDDVERLTVRLDAAGLGWLDAPMSGGPSRARGGSMSLMVAAAPALFAAHQALLRHLTARLFTLGPRPGDGARTKLINNLLAAVNLAAAAEALALAGRIGLNPALTQAVIDQSSGQSWIGGDRIARALVGDFAPRAHSSLLAKDSALAMAIAAQAAVVPALGGQAAAMFQAALAAGYGDEDDARLLSLLQQRWPVAGPAAQDAAQSAP